MSTYYRGMWLSPHTLIEPTEREIAMRRVRVARALRRLVMLQRLRLTLGRKLP